MQHLFIYFVIIRCSTLESYNLYNSFLIFYFIPSIKELQQKDSSFPGILRFGCYCVQDTTHIHGFLKSKLRTYEQRGGSQIGKYNSLILWYKMQKFFTFRELSVFWGELSGGAELRYFIIWCNKLFHTSSQGFDKNLIYALCLCKKYFFLSKLIL